MAQRGVRQIICSCDKQVKRWQGHSLCHLIFYLNIWIFSASGCFKSVARVSRGNNKDVLGMLEECIKLFPGFLRGVSRRFHVCVTRLFNLYVKNSSKVFQGCFSGVWRLYLRGFSKHFVLWRLQGCFFCQAQFQFQLLMF